MFPLSVGSYVKVGMAFVFVCLVFYSGWHMRDRDFTVYKMQQAALLEKRQAENEAHAKEDAIKYKGLKDELDTKSLLLKRYYSSIGVRSSGSTTMLSGQGSSTGTPTRPTYEVLSGQCAETTLKYMLLQKYERERLNLPQPEGE